MKKITFLVAFLLLSLVSFGQTAIQYGFSATSGTYTELATPTVLASSTTDSGATSLDDVDYRVAFPAGFSFSYQGTTQTDLNINTNGYVGFGTVLWTNYTYAPLSTNPSGGTTNGIISAFGADLNAYSSASTAPGSLSWKVEGTGTDEVLVVQYKNFKRYENSSVVDRLLNFQIRLYESTHATKANYIELVYGNCSIGDTAETGIDVGIRGANTGWAANVNSVMLNNTPVGTACNWSSPVVANNNTNGMIFSTANTAITIPNGLTYTFFPQGASAPNPVRTFAATTFDSTSAVISWTAPTGATSYNVQYRAVGSCSWTNFSGNPVNATTATITGLTQSVSYQVRVQASNGTVNSIWSHIPNTSGSGDGYTATGTFTTVPTCVSPTAFALTTGSITPFGATFTWTASTTNPSSGYDYYVVSNNTAPISTTAPTGTVSTGTTLTLSTLSPLTSYYIYIRSNCGGGAVSAWSSAVTFTTPATCLAPTALSLAAGSTTSSAASLSWTASTSNVAGGYDYYISTSSTAPTASTVPTGNQPTGTSLSLTALIPDTVYYVWVRSNCGGGDTSVWTSSISFRTECTASVPTDTVENFSSFTGSMPSPACWREGTGLLGATPLSLTGTSSSWTSDNYNNSGSNANGNAVGINLYGTDNEWFVSPPIDLGTAIDYQLEFDRLITPYNASTPLVTNMGEKFVKVVVSTDGGLTWSEANVIKTYNNSNIPSVTANEIISLANYTGTIKIGFYGYSTTTTQDLDFFIDNFKISPIPQCGLPASPSFVSATDVSATVSWTAPVAAPANGYEYYVGTTTTAPVAGSTATGSVAAGVTTVTINTLTPLTTYYVWVRSKCSTNLFSEWVGPVMFGTLCDSGEVLTTTPGIVCGQGTATLQATANAGATLNWYSAATGGVLLGTGTSYTTPVITATTNYYVSAGNVTNNLNVAIGQGGSASGGLGISPYSHGWGGVKSQFIVKASELLSAGVTPGNINALGFTITSLGTTTLNNFAVSLGTTTQSVATASQIDGLTGVYSNAAQTLTLGLNNYTFTTPFNWDGTSNLVVQVCYSNANTGGSSSSVQYDNAGFVSTTYTYADNQQANAVCSAITGDVNGSGGTSTSSSRPKITFNTTALCLSPRVQVAATVNAAPAVTATATDADICVGESTTISVTSANAGYTYTWMPGNLTGATQTVSPTADTTYTVTGFDSTSNCTVLATVFVNVNALPTAVTVSPAAPTVCEGTTQLLTAIGASASGNAVLGTGTTAPGSTSWPNPFSAWYGGTKTQMLFKANELQAQGLVAGAAITTLSFDFNAINATGVLNDLRIKMGTTGVANMTAGFVASSSLTTVYNATYTPAATGIVPFTLTTPFMWDGSDIIVEVAHNAGNSGNGSGTRTNATATTFDSVYYGAKDGVSPAGVTGLDAVAQADYSVKGAMAMRPNIVFAYNLQNSVVWTPATGLYTNAAATTPYTGTNSATVYAMPAANATYTATVTNAAGCTIATNVTVNVSSTPAPTVANATQTFCNSATVTELAATGTTIQWYAAATGGTALTAATALVNGSTYYASQTVNGCQSLLRTAVAVVINVTPAPVASSQTFCNTGTVANLVATGTSVQWYAAATGGTALAANTALATGSYFVSQTVSGCESPRTEVAVTVNVTPAPVAVAQTFCNTAIMADLDATGTNVKWYTTATGGTALVDNAPLATGSYYASQTIAGCESATRTEVAVTVNVTPAPVAVAQTFCNSGTVGNLVATGTSVQWYAAATGGTALTADTALATGSYYASQTISGCESATRTEVAVTVNVTPAPVAVAQTFCNVGTVGQLDATGTSVQWYSAATGGTALAANTALATGSYFASQTINGCESPRTEVAVTITTVAAPTGQATQAISIAEAGDTATIEEIIVTAEGTVTWYNSEADALTGNAPIAAGTELVSGNTYYATQTVNGCTSDTTLAVTVSLVLGKEDFDVSAFTYYPNPVKDVLTVSFTKDITSITVVNLLGQQVITLKPNTTEAKVDMTALADGTYMVTLRSGNAVKTIKIVKGNR